MVGLAAEKRYETIFQNSQFKKKKTSLKLKKMILFKISF